MPLLTRNPHTPTIPNALHICLYRAGPWYLWLHLRNDRGWATTRARGWNDGQPDRHGEGRCQAGAARGELPRLPRLWDHGQEASCAGAVCALCTVVEVCTVCPFFFSSKRWPVVVRMLPVRANPWVPGCEGACMCTMPNSTAALV